MMKTFVIAILLLSLTATAGHSGGLKVLRDASPYRVEVEIDRNPLVVGDNRIEIGVREASGKAVTDAKVLVNYYMPPMPRMAPMNYKTEAGLKGEKYRATMALIMAGPWYIRIIIDRRGSTVTTKFNVDAQ
jgi:hypothetical protein